METQMTTLSAAILLFLIMDPLGNIPIFLSLLKDVAPKRRRKVMIRELLIALGVLLGFLIGGQHLLRLLQLRQESISIAGGIVLFLIGIRMVFPPADGGGIAGERAAHPADRALEAVLLEIEISGAQMIRMAKVGRRKAGVLQPGEEFRVGHGRRSRNRWLDRASSSRP